MHEKYKKFQCMSPACDFAFWKIMGGRQLEPPEADTLLREREVGPLEGFRSRIGRPFSAKLKLNDANEVEFDFGDGADDDDAEAPDFTGQTPLGPCPKCKSRVFETRATRTCARRRSVPTRPATSARAARSCSGRSSARRWRSCSRPARPISCSSCRRARARPFSAFLVRQPDGKVGFEFEAKDPTQGARAARAARLALRVLGAHPRDKKPVELHAGRYGPYVKHGDVNATLPDRDKVDALTLDDALALLAEKAAKQGTCGAGVDPQAAPDTAEDRRRAARRLRPRPPRLARRRPGSRRPRRRSSARQRPPRSPPRKPKRNRRRKLVAPPQESRRERPARANAGGSPIEPEYPPTMFR